MTQKDSLGKCRGEPFSAMGAVLRNSVLFPSNTSLLLTPLWLLTLTFSQQGPAGIMAQCVPDNGSGYIPSPVTWVSGKLVSKSSVFVSDFPPISWTNYIFLQLPLLPIKNTPYSFEKIVCSMPRKAIISFFLLIGEKSAMPDWNNWKNRLPN